MKQIQQPNGPLNETSGSQFQRVSNIITYSKHILILRPQKVKVVYINIENTFH